MYRSILVPIDGSTLSQRALAAALELARGSGARLRIVHAEERNPALDGAAVAIVAGVTNEEIALAAERATDTLGTPVSAALLEPPVVEAIVADARAHEADLIVMGTHARGGARRAWLGSVAQGVVAEADCPVLLVRDRRSNVRLRPAIEHVLVPIDGSPESAAAVDDALVLAAARHASLSLLRVITPPYLVGRRDPDDDEEPELDPSALQERRREAELYVDMFVDQLRARGIDVSGKVTLSTDPAAEILDEARDQGADMIVLSTHARRGLTRLLLGSVADRVLRGAAVPVLLCRHPAEPRQRPGERTARQVPRST